MRIRASGAPRGAERARREPAMWVVARERGGQLRLRWWWCGCASDESSAGMLCMDGWVVVPLLGPGPGQACASGGARA